MPADNGGGIDIQSGSLTMSHGRLCFNEAGGDAGGGANVYSGTATFNNVSIDTNTASIEGGGLENNISGGGIITADSCTFFGDNTNTEDGGAVNNEAGYLSIGNSVIKYCYAVDVGAVAIYGGDCLVTNSTIDSNYSAAYVGGIAIVPFSGGNSLTMIGDTVEENTSEGGDGGGIYAAPVSYFTFENGAVTTNSAAHRGGGIFFDGGNDTVGTSSISENSGASGGGIYNDDAESLYLSNVDIESNTTFGDGGGIYDEIGLIFWNGGSLAFNLADGEGNAIYFDAHDGNDTLSNITMLGNTVLDIFNNTRGSYQVVVINNVTAPSAVVSSPSVIDSTDVTLEGTVYPDSMNVSVKFLYGTTSGNYEDSVYATPSTAAGDTGVPVSAAITGISPDSTYYYAISITGSSSYYFRSGETSFHTGMQSAIGFNFVASNGTFNSIASTGTSAGVSDHDEGVSGGLPIGFTFHFDGIPITEVFAAANGWLSFNPASTSDGAYTHSGFLGETPSTMAPFLAPLSADLLIRGDIYYETDGTAPNRTFTVEWDAAVGYGNSDVGPPASDQLSFQVILHESNGEIQFVYHRGPDAGVHFNTEDSHVCVGLVDTAGNFISVSGLTSTATISSASENDNITPPPSEGLTFSFTPTMYDYPLAVQATNFSATTDVGSVTLSWKTQSEVNNAGFNILREDPQTNSGSTSLATGFKLIASYISDNSLKGSGTSSAGKVYSFTDNHVTSGATYEYKIQSVSTNGTTTDLNTLTATVNIPKNYALYQNYPNPFNPSTTIRFDLKEQSTVTLEIYNLLGQKVIEQNYGAMDAGRYNEIVNMDRFASGVYLCRIAAVGNDGQRFVSVKKLVLMK